MDTPTTPEPVPDPSPAPPPAPSWTPTYGPAPRGRSRWRGVAATTLAAGLLATGLGVGALIGSAHAEQVTSTPATTAQQLPDRSTTDGSGAWGGPAGGTGQLPDGTAPQGLPGAAGGTGTGSTGTDATDEQSRGLVLIDTVLPEGEAAGTGMVLDEDGTVLTNYHVVEGSTSITVTDAVTGTTYDASVIGHDATADVALLQLDDASDLTPITVDDDGDAGVSDAVTAVGNAEGQGYLSASSGTVQALGQSITTSATTSTLGESLTDLIETDASVVGGYSGGALLTTARASWIGTA